jgi:hypothetical protein
MFIKNIDDEENKNIKWYKCISENKKNYLIDNDILPASSRTNKNDVIEWMFIDCQSLRQTLKFYDKKAKY